MCPLAFAGLSHNSYCLHGFLEVKNFKSLVFAVFFERLGFKLQCPVQQTCHLLSQDYSHCHTSRINRLQMHFLNQLRSSWSAPWPEAWTIACRDLGDWYFNLCWPSSEIALNQIRRGSHKCHLFIVLGQLCYLLSTETLPRHSNLQPKAQVNNRWHLDPRLTSQTTMTLLFI